MNMDDIAIKHKKIIGEGLNKLKPGENFTQTASDLYSNFSVKNTLGTVMENLLFGINLGRKDLFPDRNLDVNLDKERLGFDLPKGGRINYGWNENDPHLGSNTKRLTWSKEF